VKIVFLASASSIHAFRWVKCFADRGHDVHWITLVPSKFETPPNVTLHVFPESRFHKFFPPTLIATLLRVRRLIRRIDPDLIHAHYAGMNGLAAVVSGFHPYVLTAWGSDVLIQAKTRTKGPLVRMALHKADVITCDAQHMHDAMVQLGVPSRKIRIVYFGTDTERFKPGRNGAAAPSRPPTVISLRSLWPLYDIDSLVNAVPLVLKRVPNAKFIIAGGGPERERLEALAGSLGVSQSVDFIGPYQATELPKYLNGADVYVSTSLSDAGLSASTAEAMACGTPVVVTDSGENRLWVEDGVNGFVVPTRAPEALAARISDLLEREDLRRKFGELGRQTIVERNDFNTEMSKIERLYHEVGAAPERSA
jgi:L-malate glycosyltransferase